MTGADRFNYKHSEETKKKIGLKSSMKKHTMETKEKIGRHSRGKTYEQLYGKEKADKLKEIRRCNMLGKSMPKISESLKENYKNGYISPRKGKLAWNSGLTKDTSDILKRQAEKQSKSISGINHPLYGKKHKKESLIKMSISAIRRKATLYNTIPEKIMSNILTEYNIPFESQYNFNNKFRCDFAIPSKKIIIECDGDYWHNLDRVKKKDRAENAYIIKCGWKILRFWEYELKNNINNIKSIIKLEVPNDN